MKLTLVPLPSFLDVVALTTSLPLTAATLTACPFCHVRPVNFFDIKLVQAEPTPLAPIVVRSSSNDVPAFVLVHAATGRSILLPSESVTSSCGIPRPLSTIVNSSPLIVTLIWLACLNPVRIASSIALSIISSTILLRAGTYSTVCHLPKMKRSTVSFEVEPRYIPVRMRTWSRADRILNCSLLIVCPSIIYTPL